MIRFAAAVLLGALICGPALADDSYFATGAELRHKGQALQLPFTTELNEVAVLVPCALFGGEYRQATECVVRKKMHEQHATLVFGWYGTLVEHQLPAHWISVYAIGTQEEHLG